MELLQSEIDFLELYRVRFSYDKGSGYTFMAGKDNLQRVRNILLKLEGEQAVQLFPLIVGCGGCDETYDMVQYTYEKLDEYYAKRKENKQE